MRRKRQIPRSRFVSRWLYGLAKLQLPRALLAALAVLARGHSTTVLVLFFAYALFDRANLQALPLK